jgi:hypothetical protein
MLMVVVVGAAVFVLVLDLGRLRRAARARDVSNRRQVVPIDAMAQPKNERCQQ